MNTPTTPTTPATQAAQSWLWPDRNIGKRESRQLREEHNRTVNSHADLLAALREVAAMLADHPDAQRGNSKVHYLMHATSAAIAKAEGRA